MLSSLAKDSDDIALGGIYRNTCHPSGKTFFNRRTNMGLLVANTRVL